MKQSKRDNVLMEIDDLQKRRRKQFFKCAVALAVIITLVAIKTALETMGILPTGNVAAEAVSMFAGIGLAIVGGMASIEATKCTNTIKGLAYKYKIRPEEYEKKKRKRK